MAYTSFRVIDSHTAGEPTRTIVEGGPAWVGKTIEERLQHAKEQFDGYRRALVNEPRGSEVMVGAHLLPPIDPQNDAGVIFFNNVGYLGMCGHGMIGVIETLRFLGRTKPGQLRIETIAGTVTATLLENGMVQLVNVPSYRTHAAVSLTTASFGTFLVDIAYGGNWFCLAKTDRFEQTVAPIEDLMRIAKELLDAVRSIEPRVDHVELFGNPIHADSHSRNFVLCPGAMYDRSPCGTGTSAKLACLAADNQLQEQETWVQEGVLGTSFLGRFTWIDREKGVVSPTICGRAYVNADSRIVVDDDDPFAWGIVPV
jgi:4-hydroxyproline epimerase